MFAAVFVGLWRLPLVERRFALVLLTTLCVAILPLTWEDRKAVWFILAALFALIHADVGAPVVLPGRRVTAVVGRAQTRGPVAASSRAARRDATT
jgi:hypothetical protein